MRRDEVAVLAHSGDRIGTLVVAHPNQGRPRRQRVQLTRVQPRPTPTDTTEAVGAKRGAADGTSPRGEQPLSEDPCPRARK